MKEIDQSIQARVGRILSSGRGPAKVDQFRAQMIAPLQGLADLNAGSFRDANRATAISKKTSGSG